MCALWASTQGTGVINIGKGHPNPSLFPAAEVAAAYEKALSPSGTGSSLLQYGRMQGNSDFCISLSAWLREKANRKKVTPEEILITTGAGPGLAMACQLFSSPGDVRESFIITLVQCADASWAGYIHRLASIFLHVLHFS